MVSEVIKYRTENGQEFDTLEAAQMEERNEVFVTELHQTAQRADLLSNYAIEIDELAKVLTTPMHPLRNVIIGYLGMSGAVTSNNVRDRILDDALSIMGAGHMWIVNAKETSNDSLKDREAMYKRAETNMLEIINDFRDRWVQQSN